MLMSVLYWSLGAVGLAVACRFVPGFKCITFCKYKTIKRNRAIKKLHNMVLFTKSQKIHILNCEEQSTKALVKLYDSTTPFGCNSINQEQWLIDARSILKERIAERHLLES